MSQNLKCCVLCGSDQDVLVLIRKKGLDSLKAACVSRDETHRTFHFVDGASYVHEKCRKQYVSKRNIEQWKQKQSSGFLKTGSGKRSRCNSGGQVAKLCLFCGVELDKGNKENISHVTTTDFGKTVRQVCLSRSDDWSTDVLSRLNVIVDCVAQRVGYHIVCSQNFRTGRNIPNISLMDL